MAMLNNQRVSHSNMEQKLWRSLTQTPQKESNTILLDVILVYIYIGAYAQWDWFLSYVTITGHHGFDQR